MTSRRVREVLMLLLIPCLGCFGTRGGDLAAIQQWPLGPRGSAKPIAVEVTGFREWTPASGRRYRFDVEEYRESITQALSDSGLFSRVSDTAAPGERISRIEIQATETLKGSGGLTALTLYLVPFGRIHTYALKMNWIDAEGEAIATCARTETTTLWWHLAFVFTWPFNRPLSVARNVRYDLTRESLVEAAAEGLF